MNGSMVYLSQHAPYEYEINDWLEYITFKIVIILFESNGGLDAPPNEHPAGVIKTNTLHINMYSFGIARLRFSWIWNIIKFYSRGGITNN